MLGDSWGVAQTLQFSRELGRPSLVRASHLPRCSVPQEPLSPEASLPPLLATMPITGVKSQQDPGGDVLSLIREDRDSTQ